MCHSFHTIHIWLFVNQHENMQNLGSHKHLEFKKNQITKAFIPFDENWLKIEIHPIWYQTIYR